MQPSEYISKSNAPLLLLPLQKPPRVVARSAGASSELQHPLPLDRHLLLGNVSRTQHALDDRKFLNLFTIIGAHPRAVDDLKEWGKCARTVISLGRRAVDIVEVCVKGKWMVVFLIPLLAHSLAHSLTHLITQWPRR